MCVVSIMWTNRPLILVLILLMSVQSACAQEQISDPVSVPTIISNTPKVDDLGSRKDNQIKQENLQAYCDQSSIVLSKYEKKIAFDIIETHSEIYFDGEAADFDGRDESENLIKDYSGWVSEVDCLDDSMEIYLSGHDGKAFKEFLALRYDLLSRTIEVIDLNENP